MSEGCRTIRDTESEQKRFDKAIKSESKDVPAEHIEMLYSKATDITRVTFRTLTNLKNTAKTMISKFRNMYGQPKRKSCQYLPTASSNKLVKNSTRTQDRMS